MQPRKVQMVHVCAVKSAGRHKAAADPLARKDRSRHSGPQALTSDMMHEKRADDVGRVPAAIVTGGRSINPNVEAKSEKA